MAIDLVTGYRGNNHITAEQWADLNRGIVGSGAILNVGNKMSVSIQTANQITVSDGVAVFDGREFYIEHGDSVNVTIASGTQNKMRNDIVYIEYAQDAVSGVETAAIKVAEGTPATSNPADPEINDADIRDGVLLSQKKLCRVRIVNTAIDGIDMLVDVIDAIPDIMEKINNLSKGKSNTGHTHDDRYYTETEVTNLLSGKSDTSHTHDGRYYTETEVNNLLSGKSNTNHTHSYLPLSGGTITGNLSALGHVYMSYNKKILWGSNGMIWGSAAQQMFLAASTDTNYVLHFGVHDNAWALDPDVSGKLDMGTSNHKWNHVYANTGTIQTSDRNLKKNIEPLTDKHFEFFTMLQPVSFQFVDGKSGRTHVGFVAQDVESAMVECGLSDLDFAGFCKDQKTVPVEKTVEVEQTVMVEKVVNVARTDDETGEAVYEEQTLYEPQTITVEETVREDVPVEGEYVYSLRYEEFIALNTYVTQRLYDELSNMKETLDALMKKVDALEKE